MNPGHALPGDTVATHVFDHHAQAEAAIQRLSKAGVDVTKLSLVGRGYHTEEHPLGFYTSGDRIRSWGANGAFWGGIWGLLLAPAVFFIPGLGLLAMAGPVTTALVGALEGAVVVGGLSALGAALAGIGVPREDAIRYETALKADKYLLMVQGDAALQARVRTLLGEPQVQATEV